MPVVCGPGNAARPAKYGSKSMAYKDASGISTIKVAMSTGLAEA
jgi:hypothetical protein